MTCVTTNTGGITGSFEAVFDITQTELDCSTSLTANTATIWTHPYDYDVTAMAFD